MRRSDIVLREGVELSEVNVVSRKLGTMKAAQQCDE